MSTIDGGSFEYFEQELADATRERAVLRAVVNQSPMALSLRDMDSRFIWVNSRFETLFDVNSENCIGRLPHEVMPTPLADAISVREQQVWAGDIPKSQTHQLVIKGETRHFFCINSAVREPNGEPFGTSTIALDVTALRVNEAELEGTRSLMESLLAHYPFPVVARDMDGRIMLVNNAWEDFEGRTRGEAMGRRSADILPLERAQHFDEQTQRVITSRTSVREELTLDYGNEERVIEFLKFPLFDSKGEVFGVGGTALDVTDQRRVEDQLRQAMKMEAVGQLTGGVAHDFNNLLAVILGRVGLLGRGVGVAEHHVAEIGKAAQRGSELVTQLLSFSRRRALQPTAVNVSNLVQGLVQLLSRTVGEATQLRTRIAGDCANVSADPGQIESALVNLVINARDAMQDGGEIVISGVNTKVNAGDFADAPELAGDFVSLAVMDQGSGMSAELVARAFDPFFTTKPVGQGSGLGLSMVYGFAKQSGGHAVIESEPGRGTTVKVYLKQANATPAEKPVGQDASDRESPRATNLHILVLEDDHHVATLLGEMLDVLGHRASIAANPGMARALLATHKDIAIVVSDVMLKLGETGPEFVREIQKTYPDLKAIFMSGYTPEHIRRRSGFGAQIAVLQKPFTEDDLLDALDDVLS